MDPLALAAALKDPVVIAAACLGVFEIRALRRHVGRLFTKVEELEELQGKMETRVAVLEDRQHQRLRGASPRG